MILSRLRYMLGFLHNYIGLDISMISRGNFAFCWFFIDGLYCIYHFGGMVLQVPSHTYGPTHCDLWVSTAHSRKGDRNCYYEQIYTWNTIYTLMGLARIDNKMLFVLTGRCRIGYWFSKCHDNSISCCPHLAFDQYYYLLIIPRPALHTVSSSCPLLCILNTLMVSVWLKTSHEGRKLNFNVLFQRN